MYLGYDINSTNEEELAEVRDLLIEQKDNNIVQGYLVDEVKDKMVGGEAAMAVMWSGDAMYAMDLDEEGVLTYVVPEEGKADKYVIGHDLSQFSMSTQKPQIWVNRYDTKLALNATSLINDAVDFPISLYAPMSGDYTISLNLQPYDEYTVYLTFDGKVIWNLSNSEYKMTLTNGVNSHYGIRLSAHKTPSVATDIDEAIIDADGSTRKVLINGQVFIIRGDNVYSIDGQMVK